MKLSVSSPRTIAAFPTILGSFSTLSMLIAAAPVAASTFQVTTTAEVRQDIIPGLAPNYYHENQGEEDPLQEGFIWFDEAVRVLTEDANVWDQSQIPTIPDPTAPNVITSQAQLTGTWTFDASFLYNFDDNIKGSQSEDGGLEGQLLGETSDVSIFRVNQGGAEVDSGLATTTRVGVANDLMVGGGDESLDVLVIEAEFPNDPNVESSGIQLQMAFEENWFEQFVDGDLDIDGNFADADTGEQLTGDARFEAFFNGVIVSAVEYKETVTYDFGSILPTGYEIRPGDKMFDLLVVSEANERDLNFVSFGAADGSSEETPLLPAGVLEGDGDEGTPPTFGFDVSGAGTDIVFIDPELTVGYTYELQGDGQIAAFVAPSESAVAVPIGFAGYELLVVGGNADGQTFFVMPGERIDFSESDLVRRLVLTGIPLDAEIDPTDFQTFVAGFSFFNVTDGSFVTQTAIVEDPDVAPAVPLPAGAWLMLTALGGFAALRRRQKS